MTKPFNPALPAQTRDGRPVRILCTDAKEPWPIAVLIDCGTHDSFARRGMDGCFDSGYEDCADLINVPTKRKGWIGVRSISTQGTLVANSSEVYQSEIAARAQEGRLFQQFIEIEFDE